MESMLISNTSDNIVTDAQQEEWRISTEQNSSKSSAYKHKPLPTTLKRHVIFLPPAINLLLPSLDNDPKEEDVDPLVKMLPRSLQPNNYVLFAQLTLFRNHCQENKLEIETIAEASRLANGMKFESKFPLTNRKSGLPDFNCTYYNHRRR
ncbi:Hypothetical predicted protein, partial [Paramuricea clavata]